MATTSTFDGYLGDETTRLLARAIAAVRKTKSLKAAQQLAVIDNLVLAVLGEGS